MTGWGEAILTTTKGKPPGPFNGNGFITKLLIAITPLLIVGVTTLFSWVIQLRADHLTRQDAAQHIELRHRDLVTRGELEQRFVRIEAKLDRLLEIRRVDER